MARYIRYTEDKICQLEKEGRGKGEQEEYIPWIKVGEISSEGRSHRIAGLIVNRTYHFLSDLEMYYYYSVSWENDITDIREQYPLNRADTLRIAEKLAYEHPKYTDTKVMTVMTTDLLLTVRTDAGQKLVACAVKPSSKITRTEENRRTLEKLCIEKEYWYERSVKWNLVTEESIDIKRAKNIMFLLGKWNNPLQHKISHENTTILTNRLIDEISKQSGNTIANICRIVDQDMDMVPGDALAWMHYLVAHKIFPVNVDNYSSKMKAANTVNIDELILRRQSVYEDIAIS